MSRTDARRGSRSTATGSRRPCRRRSPVTRKRFANPAAIPFHSRWRHFEAGGRDRWAALAPAPRGTAEGRDRAPPHGPRRRVGAARCRRGPGLVATASPAPARPTRAPRGWAWRASTCSPTAPFSRDAKGDPLRVDAERLAALTPMDIAMGFQVKAHNPLTGLEGRAEPAAQAGRCRPRSAGRAVRHRGARSGGGSDVKAASILAAVLDKLSPIWPSPMGDVWPHPVARPRAVPQALAVAVLFAGRADRGRRPQGCRARRADRPAGVSQRRLAGRCRRAAAQAVARC